MGKNREQLVRSLYVLLCHLNNAFPLVACVLTDSWQEGVSAEFRGHTFSSILPKKAGSRNSKTSVARWVFSPKNRSQKHKLAGKSPNADLPNETVEQTSKLSRHFVFS